MSRPAWTESRTFLLGALALGTILVACRTDASPPEAVATEPPRARTSVPEPTSPAATATPTATATNATTPAVSPPPADACSGEGRRVCLIPLADFSEPPVESLVKHLLEQGIPAVEAPAVRLEISDIDRARSQLSANQATARVEAAYPHLQDDPDVTVIALTDFDIFIEGLTLNWAFGMRGQHTNIISTARMYEETWGGTRDDDRRDSRLRKMLLRYVGFFHLGLPNNDSPLTVLYRHLNGLSELDAMREGILEPSQLPRPPTAVARWAEAFCAASEHYAVREYRADVDFYRSWDLSLPVEDARRLAEAYLEAMRAARIEYGEGLAGAVRFVEDGHGWLRTLHDDFERALDVSVRELEVARADLGRANSTAGVAGRLTELWVTLWSHPDTAAVYDSYEALPLPVFVALSDAGPCGGFAPGSAFTDPVL